jgi:hypothetical protein
MIFYIGMHMHKIHTQLHCVIFCFALLLYLSPKNNSFCFKRKDNNTI